MLERVVAFAGRMVLAADDQHFFAFERGGADRALGVVDAEVHAAFEACFRLDGERVRTFGRQAREVARGFVPERIMRSHDQLVAEDRIRVVARVQLDRLAVFRVFDRRVFVDQAAVLDDLLHEEFQIFERVELRLSRHRDRAFRVDRNRQRIMPLSRDSQLAVRVEFFAKIIELVFLGRI